jgi:mRNA turnover protein 4
VHLTQTDKKGRAQKSKLIEDLRECADQYSRVYVFDVVNMRNSKLKEAREHWHTSRFFLGKNKVMALALGRDEPEAYKENMHLISEQITGQRGLLFSDVGPKEVRKFFGSFAESNFARSGFVAPRGFSVPSGILKQVRPSAAVAM